MTLVSIRSNEGADVQPYLAWDTVWNPATGQGDWTLAGATEAHNRGGLRAIAGLATAVEIALFTDRRCPEGHPLAKFVEDGDLRGWFGNAIDVRADLSEGELGSLLWLIERAPLTDEVVRWAQTMAEEALAPLVAQGAAAKITVVTSVSYGNRLDIACDLFARDGTTIYSKKFEILWQQVGL